MPLNLLERARIWTRNDSMLSVWSVGHLSTGSILDRRILADYGALTSAMIPEGNDRRRIMKLVQRGKPRATGQSVTFQVDENDPDLVSLFGGQHGSVEGQAMVDELGAVFGYLWVETDGRLSYEVVIEDPVAGRISDFLLRDANAYLNPNHRGVFSPTLDDPSDKSSNPSPEEVAWLRQGKMANLIYGSLVWMPLESQTTNDALIR